MNEQSFPCVCCGYMTLQGFPGSYEICPICFWEDDAVQLKFPTMAGGANRVSLIQGQHNYREFAASELRLLQYVRPVTQADKRDPAWRRIDLAVDRFDLLPWSDWPEDSTRLYWWRPSFWNSTDANGDDALEVAAWQLVAGDLTSENLPRLARDALVRGLESPSLRVLAGQNPADARESRDLFVRALSELNIPLLDEDEAVWRLVRSVAKAIVSGAMKPQAGADLMWRSYSHRLSEEGDLRVFVGLASQLEDHPNDRARLEQLIVLAAGDLLQRSAPRRWIRITASAVSPLSHYGPTGYSYLALEEEPLSPRLVADFEAWNTWYLAVVEGWPKRGGFDSQQDAEAFVDQGRVLAARLQDELGAEHHIEYWPEPIRPPGLKLSPQRAKRWF